MPFLDNERAWAEGSSADQYPMYRKETKRLHSDDDDRVNYLAAGYVGKSGRAIRMGG